MKNISQEIRTHFTDRISDDLAHYARELVFLNSRYLFVWRMGKTQMAHCTHCRAEYPLGEGKVYFKHNETTQCLQCGSECVVKSNGRGRSKLFDDAYIVWYDKSIADPNVLVATVYYTYRSYTGDYRQTETQFKAIARYIFEPGKGGTQFRKNWTGNEDTWQKKSSVTSYVRPYITSWYSKIESFLSTENIEKAVSGTPFQYCMWQEYRDEAFDYVTFFDFAAKYPCIEYLTKFGLRNVVKDKLQGRPTLGVIYWRGKSLEKVLRMSKTELKQLRQIAGDISPLSLRSFHFWRKRGWSISPQDAHVLKGVTERYYLEMLEEYNDFGSDVQIAQYLLKQFQRPDAPKNYTSTTYVLTEWRDYIRSCKELGIELVREHVRFPSNLHQAHEKTTRKVKLKRDEALNALILNRVAILEAFSYTDGTYLIRPAQSSIELFDEGKALQHCVGGYAGEYANGSTDLFVLRSIADIETPFCTVEVKSGEIRQARGFKNSGPAEDVQAFLKRFEQNLRKVKRRAKCSAAPTELLAG